MNSIHSLMNEQYQQLKNVTPSNIKILLNNCTNQTTKIREEIIITQRILCLLPLIDSNNYPAFFPENKNTFYKHISQSVEILRDSISPQQVQFISKTYDFFIQNPMELVNVTLSIERSEESLMPFLTYSIIPSFFGYFSCLEHLSLAFAFYCALITRASKPTIIFMLKPFFCNATTYRFIEILSNEVIQFFCQDVRLSNTYRSKKTFNTLMDEHASTFFDRIISSLKYLPDIHLKTLQFMHNFQWTGVQVFQFFLSSFVVPQLIEFIQNSNFAIHVTEFKSMANRLSIQITEDKLNPFFREYSIFEIPPAFNDFDLPYLNFLMTPLDNSIFFEAAKPIVQFPKLLLMLQNNKFMGRNQPYAPIWLKVFPKAPIPVLHSASWRNLIFNSKLLSSNLNFQNSQNFQNDFLKKKKQKINIPLFQRRFRMIQMIAREHDVDAFDIISGNHKFDQSTKIIKSSLNEKAIDISGVCDDCINIVMNSTSFSANTGNISNSDELCDKCLKLLSERKPMTFYDYALNVSFSKLQKRASLFEKLLVHKFALKRLNKWLDIVKGYFDITIFSLTDKIVMNFFSFAQTKNNLIQNSLKESPSILLQKVALFFDTQSTCQLYFCIRAELLLTHFKLILPKFQQKTKKFDEIWQKEKNSLSSLNLPQFSNSQSLKVIYNVLSNVHNTMNMINMIPFHRRYFRIIDCLRNYKNFCRVTKLKSSLLDYFLKLCSDSSFLVSVLEISAMLMKFPSFLALCSKEERLLWYELESELQTALNPSHELTSSYNEIHDLILQFVCRYAVE
ncbi:hypothetical protein TRFO_04450 [Tritrichomonas foetus]|uniref:Uncharacterized protein n=1 Tax=Tritrichomonas foetus TaxID=1144522 RepID=A0A1J4KJA6_9EUKA|nr:hypothetical protein TRFO_04450 [Tritrichomonas foetus]|eukprot:OHT09900.1 hypothetical protein TRFO_04450 [Tritrichomonas foetus]